MLLGLSGKLEPHLQVIIEQLSKGESGDWTSKETGP